MRPDCIAPEKEDTNGQNLQALRHQWQAVAPPHLARRHDYPDDALSAIASGLVGARLSGFSAYAKELIDTGYNLYIETREEEKAQKPDKPDIVQVDLVSGQLTQQPAAFYNRITVPEWLADRQITAALQREQNFGASLTKDSINSGRLRAPAPVRQALMQKDERARRQLAAVLS